MNVLIAYSSGFGTTKEISEKIGQVLKDGNAMDVSVQSIDDVFDLQPFSAIVVGSSVRADRPLANVRDFFAKHHVTLAQKIVAIFAACLSANCMEGREKVKREYISQITDKYPNIKPISTVAFGGKIDFDRLNPVMKQLMKRVLEKTGIQSVGNVDTRDWIYIESWAVELRDKLRNFN